MIGRNEYALISACMLPLLGIPCCGQRTVQYNGALGWMVLQRKSRRGAHRLALGMMRWHAV